MTEKTIRVIDAASDFANVRPAEVLSGQELANRVSLGVFDGCTIVRLPSEFTIVLSIAKQDGKTLQAIPALSQSSAQGPMFWLEVTPLFSSIGGNAGRESNKGATHMAVVTKPLIPQAQRNLPASRGNGPAQTQSHSGDMTENQRRYLFRLLAARKLGLEEANTYLLEYFHVKSLRDISKQGASELIDKMVNGGDGT